MPFLPHTVDDPSIEFGAVVLAVLKGIAPSAGGLWGMGGALGLALRLLRTGAIPGRL